MNIIEIRVRAAMTLPTKAFANIRPDIELTASLDPGEDVVKAVASLQLTANTLLIAHCATLIHEQDKIQDVS